jgi:hypothetical protein
MNLSMLQMAIQGLDVQRAAIAAVKAMSQAHNPETPPEAEAAQASQGNPFLWPWSMMSAKAGAEENSLVPVPTSEQAATQEKSRVKRKPPTNGNK